MDISLGQLAPHLITAAIIGLVSLAFRSILDSLKDGITGIREGVAALASKVDGLDEKVDGHNVRMAQLDQRIATLEGQHRETNGALTDLRREHNALLVEVTKMTRSKR